jgi:glycine/D-amino acid oxidase-like deaminating enzyme
MTSSDVIIIGGGLIGACCANSLTAQGMDVTLIERHFPASGSSRACDGLILLWDKHPGPEFDFGKHSVSLWQQLVPVLEADVEFRKTGTVLINETQTGLDNTRELVASITAHGISANLLETSDLLELEPGLATDLAGGAFFPDDYQIDPRRATMAIMRKAQRQGLRFRIGEEVSDLYQPGGARAGWEVQTQSDRYSADYVVFAAGVWSVELLQKMGIEVPVRPRKGQILVVKSGPGALNHPLLEGGYETTVHAGEEKLQVALVAEVTPAGTMLIGSSRQFAGFDTSVSWDVLQALARRAARFIPAIASASLMRSYAGLRPWSPDHLPLIGPVEGFEGLHLATGHEGAGICLAPATGELIKDWISEGEAPAFGETLDPNRF